MYFAAVSGEAKPMECFLNWKWNCIFLARKIYEMRFIFPRTQCDHFRQEEVPKILVLDFNKPPLFHIQNQKRNQGTLIETGRNRPVSRNQTAILAGLSKSI